MIGLGQRNPSVLVDIRFFGRVLALEEEERRASWIGNKETSRA
jgi:hypothetical protein